MTSIKKHYIPHLTMKKKITKVSDPDFLLHEKHKTLESYGYQAILTPKLDNLNETFTQEIINEIVLWKVNRYVRLSDDILLSLNSIKLEDRKLDKEKTFKILSLLLNQRGIQLPMASTILRFKNPYIYQILDQRVYRILYGIPLSEIMKKNKKIESQIDLYISYLEKLQNACETLKINYNKADRILYMEDKYGVNKGINLTNYGTNKEHHS